MKVERTNQWLTLLAIFLVIAGIAFLAFAIQQNTQQLETQSYQS
jgi:preprotein translocase subunit YajC